MDKLLALRTLLAVAESGGFTAAAHELGKTTSSVMRLMDGLEASLGTSLLTRTTRSVTLTDAGVTYVEQVRQVLADLAGADDSVIDTGIDPMGSLRVSVSATYSRLHIAPHIATFLRQHPRVNLELVVSDSHMDLVSEKIDLALRVGVPTADPRLIVKRLGHSARCVVASPAYLQRRGHPHAASELVAHDCLRFAYKPGNRQKWVFRYPDRSESVDVGGQLLTNNLDMLAGAALGGLGIALLPQWLIGASVRDGSLTALFDDAQVTPEGGDAFVYATYLPNRRHSRKVHAFIDFAQRAIAAPGHAVRTGP
ncbi:MULTISPECIES: LysR family transcriptional regulator [unclassified Caballeronia]|uniref:LysR family transcriptional regulator n=1 Tax=unclassified Caballeronia TaxID=2646786 RepID=UPI0028632164|nr:MULTISPECIES: LysR substrate-binding domain-containing protein [unclassified Caballeronia]MDR5774279.1 LysR substrate-binding domain-containing protein [Caballeronia sp. LZ002]MDR5849714.1 LysR substrate-binding domain-containing protein [Caballeronia sp. LZ003]